MLPPLFSSCGRDLLGTRAEILSRRLKFRGFLAVKTTVIFSHHCTRPGLYLLQRSAAPSLSYFVVLVKTIVRDQALRSWKDVEIFSR